MRRFIDGRELHPAFVQGIGETPQHVKDFDAPHKGVRGEVDLELTIAGTRRQITNTDYLGRQSVLNYGLQHNAFCHKFGMNILVAKILAVIELLLGEDVVGRHGVVDIEAAGAVRGDVH